MAATTNSVRKRAPEPNGKPKVFTKVISNFPAIEGRPGMMNELINRTKNKLNTNAMIPPVHVGSLYFLK